MSLFNCSLPITPLEQYLDIGLFFGLSIGNALFYNYTWNSITNKKHRIVAPKGLYLSALHSTAVSIYYIFQCIFTDMPNFSPVQIFMLSWSFSYSLFDLKKLWDDNDLWHDHGAILLHHSCLSTSMLLLFYLIVNDQVNVVWIANIGFLSELSTPLLDYLKIKYYLQEPVHRSLYIIFVALYFFCRPVMFCWLSYQLYAINPDFINLEYNISFVISTIFLVLNIKWFYTIIQKYVKYFKQLS